MLDDEENDYVGRFSVEKMFSFHHRFLVVKKKANKFDGAKNSDQNRKRKSLRLAEVFEVDVKSKLGNPLGY